MVAAQSPPQERRRPRWPAVLAGALLAAAAGAGGLVLWSRRPVEVGLADGRLRPCPPSPNCVCSQDADEHAIAPLAFRGDPDAAFRSLAGWLRGRDDARVVLEAGDYLHAEWSTPLLGFRDDLELLLDRAGRMVHVRSASRVGRSDLGANRARVEAIRAGWVPPEGR